MAGEMTAEEARRFVIGKMFNYTCFEGTRGQGRVYADGSVVGSIQFQGAGPVRYAHLPAGTLQVKGEAVCASLRGLPIEPCFNLERTSDDSFRGAISGLGFAYCEFTRHMARRATMRTSAAPLEHGAAARPALADRSPPSSITRGASALRRKDHARRGGVRVELARAILEVAFRGRHRAAAMDDAAFGAHRPGVLGHRAHEIELQLERGPGIALASASKRSRSRARN